ncbi:MAG: hypothetical protein J6J12_08760 [Oscillospiraceae bacterium]|nr:hypothetical protein [Oscillospiraceae bacterium]
MERHVYIVVSQTGTLLSRIMKLVTKAEFNHASISLAPDLDTMYSFGRLNPYNPFWAGFVKESPRWGTFKRFSKTRILVLDLEVTEEQYQQIQSRINIISANRHHYHYNYLGLYLAAFRIPYHHKRCYYCSEFVNHLLVRSRVAGAQNTRAIIQPMHFLSLPEAKPIYTGTLIDYAKIAALSRQKSPAF